MDKNQSLKEALKTVVEVKLLGTYRIAAMESNDAKTMYIVKNSGDFSIGLSKDNNELVVSSDMEIFSTQYLGKTFSQISIPDNNLVEITSDCKYSLTKLEKKIVISRNPRAMFDHIMQEEIFESIDAVDSATDYGNKFISNHQVVLGGFEKAKNELL